MIQIKPEIITIGTEDCIEQLNAFHALLCKYSPHYKNTILYTNTKALLKETLHITFANKVHTFFTGQKYKKYIEELAFYYTDQIKNLLHDLARQSLDPLLGQTIVFQQRNNAWGFYKK